MNDNRPKLPAVRPPRKAITIAPSPSRPQTLRRIGADGREEFCTQDGWIRPVVIPTEEAAS